VPFGRDQAGQETHQQQCNEAGVEHAGMSLEEPLGRQRMNGEGGPNLMPRLFSSG
jgi:hypothetical protein